MNHPEFIFDFENYRMGVGKDIVEKRISDLVGNMRKRMNCGEGHQSVIDGAIEEISETFAAYDGDSPMPDTGIAMLTSGYIHACYHIAILQSNGRQ